jgi:hypothetical protein
METLINKSSIVVVGFYLINYMLELLKQGVCHIVALPFTLKKYLKAKEELWKFKYFTMQKYNSKIKRNPDPSRYHTSITNLKFRHKPKYPLSKTLI